MVLLLSPILLHIYSPCFSDIWHFHSYIIQQFNEIFFYTLYQEVYNYVRYTISENTHRLRLSVIIIMIYSIFEY